MTSPTTSHVDLIKPNSQPSAYPPKAKTDLLKDWLFEKIHGNKLVYNTCWEDPRTDRVMMEIDSDSDIVMITSAGDNALAYLLDGPKRVNCIDVNPRQNALLDLKLAGFNSLNWETFFEVFGNGRHANFPTAYSRQMRPLLTTRSQEYWDRQQRYFKPSGPRAGLYFHGSSGLFAWCAGQLLNLDGKLKKDLQKLLDAPNMEAQKEQYFALEERLLKRLVGGAWRQKVSLSLVGVPDSQRKFMEEEAGGLKAYVRDSFRHIFTELPIRENYFYRLYLNGKYTRDCCPAYLEEQNFETLKARSSRIEAHTTTIAEFLKKNPGQYSHFVLLDHQDWLAANAPAALDEEWQLVMANSRPGTRILLRSANSRPETVPAFVRERTRFRNDLSAPQARLDRVGTYAGTFLLEVL